MKFRFATWNINSVRLRLPLVEQFVAAYRPDILCLQEIKCVDELFPLEPLQALGFPYIRVNGQAGYHGVATLSRFPLEPRGKENFCGSGQARHLAVALNDRPIVIHNVYIPAGGDIPDPDENPKFKQKLAYLTGLADWSANCGFGPDDLHVLAGDFNVAPLENDVWSHKQLLKVVSHTPIEVEHLARLREAGNWVDVIRRHVPEEQKLYTWWSYRARDWKASNRGRRLDHIWTTPALAPAAKSMIVVEDARGWKQPSDHVPVIADFDLD
jgi:exodeoxyribonuclease-3